MATIEHDDGRRVEGVDNLTTHEGMGWKKNDVCYFPGMGWREVREEKLINITKDVTIDGRHLMYRDSSICHLHFADIFLSIVRRYHLPEDAKGHWLAFKRAHQGFADHHIDCMIEAFLKPFLEPVIIVERRKG